MAGEGRTRIVRLASGVGRAGEAASWSRFHLGWAWCALGLAGSVLLTATGPRVAGGAVGWWFSPQLPQGRTGDMAGFYLGVLMLSAAWLGLGRRLARTPEARLGELWLVGGLWCAPLLVAPALFSGDMYSYLAQGTILHLGLSPYHVAPVVLGRHGDRHVLDAVSPFWRRTTAPYGPLFLALVSLIVGVSGSQLIVGVLLVRLLELLGVVLLAVFVPRLARSLGADPCRATWLAVVSPLVLLELIAAGHNDALMVGLMVAGVSLALERRPLLGIGACALAASVKVPAGAAAVFIAVSWARSVQGRRARLWFVAEGTALAAGILATVSAATGLGLEWLSTTVLSTPGKVRLAITPVTALGWSVGSLLHAVGVEVSSRSLESAFGDAALALLALLGAVLLWRVRFDDMVMRLGLFLLAAAIGGPAAWPWYFSWGLVLVAAWPAVQRSRALPVALALAVLLVKPDGILALPLDTAPVVLAVYAALAGAALYYAKRRRGEDLAAGSDEQAAAGSGERRTGGASPALAKS